MNVNLISNLLTFKSNKFLNRNSNIEVFKNKKTESIDFRINKQVHFNNYILPQLRYKNIQSCFLLQPNQYIDQYVILGYLEAITKSSLEIVKFKTKIKDICQILLISNNDCLILDKNKFPTKKLNNFIIKQYKCQ